MYLEIDLRPMYGSRTTPNLDDYKTAMAIIKRQVEVELGWRVDAIIIKDKENVNG